MTEEQIWQHVSRNAVYLEGDTLPTRRPCENVEVGNIVFSVGFDPRSGHACELFIAKRDKSGTELEKRQMQAGIMMSKALQGELEDGD